MRDPGLPPVGSRAAAPGGGFAYLEPGADESEAKAAELDARSASS